MEVAEKDRVCGMRVRATIKANQVKTAEILMQNEQMLVEDAKMRRGNEEGRWQDDHKHLMNARMGKFWMWKGVQ